MTEEEKRALLRKKIGIPFIGFLLLQYLIFALFLRQLSGNVYVILINIIIYIGFVIYFNKFRGKLK